MKIYALTVDRGGCFYYRMRLPLTAMRAHGHQTLWGSCINIEEFDRADVIVNQYLHEEASISRWEQWRDQGKKLLVWECDDDITSVLAVTSSGSAYDNPETLPRMIRGIKASHLVTVTTPRLAEIMSQWNENVVVLPNRIPNRLLSEPVQKPAHFTMSWSASPSHQQDAQAIYPALIRIFDRFPNFTLRLYGPDVRPIGIPSWWRVELMGWQKQTYDYLKTLNGTIGIAPLEMGSQFNRAKSGIKALEYMARGMVPVCSDYPQYRELVPREAGFICKTTAQWIDAVYRASVIGRPMERVGREIASEHTIEKHVSGWIEAYEKGLDLL